MYIVNVKNSKNSENLNWKLYQEVFSVPIAQQRQRRPTHLTKNIT